MRMTLAALLLGLIIGICGTMALHLNRPGPDAGDWLAFAGALVGVAFTIAGTLWLEGYRASKRERDDQKLLLKTLDEMRSALIEANQPRGDQPVAVARAAWIEREKDLKKVFNTFIYARHYVPKRNIEAWRIIEELNDALTPEKALVDKELRHLEEEGDSEGVLGVSVSKMGQLHDRLIGILDAARQSVKNHKS